ERRDGAGARHAAAGHGRAGRSPLRRLGGAAARRQRGRCPRGGAQPTHARAGDRGARALGIAVRRAGGALPGRSCLTRRRPRRGTAPRSGGRARRVPAHRGQAGDGRPRHAGGAARREPQRAAGLRRLRGVGCGAAARRDRRGELVCRERGAGRRLPVRHQRAVARRVASSARSARVAHHPAPRSRTEL
ncbi:MAG: hypothetical protein AVDCRST_MAG60-571, partial [uncultured Nocardioides sp.]